MLAGTNWDKSISTWEALPLDSEEQFARFQEKRRWFADQRTAFWHLQEAELCLASGNFNAVQGFHVNLLKDELRSGPLLARRERLEAALKKAPVKDGN